MEVFSIDVSVSEDVTYPELNSTQVLTFRVTNTTFIAGMTYYVTMNSGKFCPQCVVTIMYVNTPYHLIKRPINPV